MPDVVWNQQGTDIQTVIDEVKRELEKAASAAPDLQLKEFELELSVVTTRETTGGGGFTFKVPFIGTIGVTGSAGQSSETTSKLTLSYAAPEPKPSETFGPDFSSLKGALATIQQSINAANKSKPHLVMSSGEVSFAFGVKKEASGKVELLILEGTRAGSQADEQTVTLKFAPKKP